LERGLKDGINCLSHRRIDGGGPPPDEVLLAEQEEVTNALVLPARELLNRALYREKDLQEVFATQKTKAEGLFDTLKKKEEEGKTLEQG